MRDTRGNEMQSKATTVKEYLAELPAERRKVIEAVRATILKNLPAGYEEGMQYGMIGYYVPHSLHPAGYHCDPRQPLPFAALGSQKNHMAIYLMCVYGDTKLRDEFSAAWKKTGKKLDMGKSCIRFKKIEDVALDVIGQTIKKVPAEKYIAFCVAAVGDQASKRATKRRALKKSAVAKKRRQ